MLTTDFSGTYDYEQEEALFAAQSIHAAWAEGYYTADEFADVVRKERVHWKKFLPETFDDWDPHFVREITSLIGYMPS